MAKWGEGDDRWIVEDRKDGSNVNGWHWEERQRMPFVREKVPVLLAGIIAESTSAGASVAVKEVKSVDGEASVSIRKGGKKLAVYDLALNITWRGQVTRVDAQPVEGTLKVSEFASGSDEDDWVLECTTTETGADAETLRRLAHSQLRPLVLQALEPIPQLLLGTF